MSWGERSCTRRKCEGATYETCNVDCPNYEWDEKTRPDSTKSEPAPDNSEIKEIAGSFYHKRKDGWRKL